MDTSEHVQCAAIVVRDDHRRNGTTLGPGMFWRALALSCSLGGAWLDVQAQSTRVGHIDDVRGIDSSASCARNFRLPPPPSPISLIRGNRPIAAMPPDSAVLLDRLRVQRFADVRFRIDAGRFGDGTFYFAPELGRCATASTTLQTRGLTMAANGLGSYRLSSRQERAGRRIVDRLLLSVENGGVVVEWGTGLLSVFALGREIRDSGTTFAVVVDSASGRALLVVKGGIVTMTGVADLGATAGRAFTFGKDGRPEPLTLTSPIIDDMAYHSGKVWTQSIRPVSTPRRMWRLVGGAVVTGGLGYLIWRAANKSDPPKAYNGVIIIGIPI